MAAASDDNDVSLVPAEWFRRRVRELERAHRERQSLARTLEHGSSGSWLAIRRATSIASQESNARGKGRREAWKKFRKRC